EERRREFERRWKDGAFNFQATFPDLLTSEAANDLAAQFIHRKIHERVDDPAIAELLCPKDHPFGAKRLCADTDYYETYNRENVTLVDVSETPIEAITPEGLRTGGVDYAFDAIVFATGFDAMTGALLDIGITGRDGLTLKEKWADGSRTYLGLAIAGFPNLFAITGPGSPSVLSNMLVSIEQHVDWVADCIDHMRGHGFGRIEPTVEAEDGWVEHVVEVGDSTLYPRANSWYVGANIPGKPRVFTPYVGGVGRYRETCDAVAAKRTTRASSSAREGPSAALVLAGETVRRGRLARLRPHPPGRAGVYRRHGGHGLRYRLDRYRCAASARTAP
ncbi:MAG: hypothetical protein O7B26_09315, partial [Planctomycetota bacterium]|nr:hypothetical protein [Planctomycetota bacterium]